MPAFDTNPLPGTLGSVFQDLRIEIGSLSSLLSNFNAWTEALEHDRINYVGPGQQFETADAFDTAWLPAAQSLLSATVSGQGSGVVIGVDVLGYNKNLEDLGNLFLPTVNEYGIVRRNGLLWELDNTSYISSLPTNLARTDTNETITGAWQFTQPMIAADPTIAAHVATKNYVDAQISVLPTTASVSAAIGAATSGLATTAFVTTSISNAVSGLASISYVTTAIANFATTSFVTTSISTAVSGLASTSYVNTQDNLKLNLTGGTLSGVLNAPAGVASLPAATTNGQAVRYEQVTPAVQADSQARADAALAAALVAAVPAGAIILWNGAIGSIPAGWFLCDGANGTPDLRNRFVVGAGSTYSVGNTGGNKDAVVVSHSHVGTALAAGDHTHGIFSSGESGGVGNFIAGAAFTNRTISTGLAGNHNHNLSIGATGEPALNANLPPYYALAYIMKA